MCVNYAVVALLPKDKMSIPSKWELNLKTSQLMKQIYRRNIAAQLEQKQIRRYLSVLPMIAMNNSIEIKSSWMIFINYYKTIPDWLSFANRSITATRQVSLGDSSVRLVIRYGSMIRS